MKASLFTKAVSTVSVLATIAAGAQATSPVLATAATRLAARLRWADRANLLPPNVASMGGWCAT